MSQEIPSFLILHNIAKRSNFGPIMRSACAMGVRQVIVVGSKKLQTFGHQGTKNCLQIYSWSSLREVRERLKARGVVVYGVEIRPDATSIWDTYFDSPTAFILGNEGSGLSECAAAICDKFLYIPQYSAATASLNVAVAAGIIFHHFASNYRKLNITMISGQTRRNSEHIRAGEKFVTSTANVPRLSYLEEPRKRCIMTSEEVLEANDLDFDSILFN